MYEAYEKDKNKLVRKGTLNYEGNLSVIRKNSKFLSYC